ncbi:hypothetical protein PTKIN_Ptkin09bG0227200 [Pterospermum kingtungense]
MMEQTPKNEMQPSASPNDKAELSSRLFEYSMKDQWEKVMAEYKKNPDCRIAKITEAEDTVLHLAVSGGKFEFVNKMVELLGDKAKEVLKAKNKKGNTPLHTAAALGNAHMCHCMASKDPSLIDERNIKNETPFFLAARFGHKDALLCLYFCYPEENRADLCSSRDESGDTILHAAINGEHFDLAYQIICKYQELVEAVNENGVSPLHVLATKTNAFKSGGRLGLFDRILYSCIIVDELKEQKIDNFLEKSTKDEENPQEKSKTSQGESSSSQTKHESNNSNGAVKESSGTSSGNNPNARKEREDPRSERYPANYATFIELLKFVMKFVMIILGFGFQRIRKIITKKQRHTWATQVMNKLIENASSMYKYSGAKTGIGNIGDMTKEFPHNPSQMMSSSHDQDTDKGDTKHSHVGTSNKQGKVVIYRMDSSKKEGNDTMVEKFLEEHRITGSVDSKTSKHAVLMKFEKKVESESTKSEIRSTPILIAASRGITEMVAKILEKFPVAIQDVDAENKNVLLLAVENRQTHTFQFLIERKILHESVFRHWDNQGNNALHLAATYGHYRPWLIPGSALQMQWEFKWYKFVKKSMAKYLLVHYNKRGQTPKQIFTETHKALVKDGSEWLTKTSESCSVVAALIATVAFATAATIPGGVNQETGKPVLQNQPAFAVFAISSLVALCFSITALVFFLAILTSRFEEKDFVNKLPRKLILGLTSLFTSIAAMLVSFCAGHFFELHDKLKFAAFPIYTATCLPISFFALAQLPLYFDLMRAIFKKVPQRSYKEFAS